MKILITASTVPEIGPLLKQFGVDDFTTQLSVGVKYLTHDIDILIPGVGLMKTAFFLGRHFAVNRYDLALNLGIAGSFSKNLAVGDVVHIISEQVADLGSEDGDRFLDVFDLGLEKPNAFPFNNRRIMNDAGGRGSKSLAGLPCVHGISLNTCHGRQESIENTINRLNPDVESMEGAAFMFACKVSKIPFFEIRAISNRVEPRNREGWNIPHAVACLNTKAIKILEEMAGEMV